MGVFMVKQEARIIERCLAAAAPFVDAFLVADTGSSDETVALAEAYCAAAGSPLRVSHHAWRNFGHNRTLSFEAACAYAEELQWSPGDSYALVLDADMKLQGDPAALRRLLAERPAGAQLQQKSGVMEWFNTRLMRLDLPWRCVGVTHEFWGGAEPLATVAPAAARIDDLGDGGCKADKFERDLRLLLEGLEAEPGNERYLFYLAQTYHCLNRPAEAIRAYERRIAAGGWVEERWYSHFMIATNYLKLNRPYDAELWAQRALALEPQRAEALMALVTHFRSNSEPFKAWHYLLKCEAMPLPTEPKLFLETDCYGHRAAYERTLLHWYVKEDRTAGALACLSYEGPAEHAVMGNVGYYAPQLDGRRQRLHFPVDPGFFSSSVAVNADRELCVRAVSYFITEGGSYSLPLGHLTTVNYAARWDPEALAFADFRRLVEDPACAERWRRPDQIQGLEDVRLCGSAFTATTREFSYCGANRVVHGSFPAMTFRPVRPPSETECEKNWLPLDERRVIYGWHPFVVGEVRAPEDDGPAAFAETLRHATPRWMRHLRGSAPPFRLGDELWALTHFVGPHAPRHYLHVFVVLDAATLQPRAHGAPFHFAHVGIEYCLGAHAWPDGLAREVQLFYSVWDRESWVCSVPAAQLRASLRPL